MRLIYNITMIALTALTVAACAGKKESAATGTTREELTFPVGERIESAAFTGEAFLRPMIQTDTVFNFPTTNTVTFAPGAHSDWHRHGGMVVLVTDGVGLYQEEGKPAQILRRGDVLQIPAGVRHWHGATKDNWFSQMVVYDASWQPTEDYNDGDNTVSDEYYNNLAAVEFAQRGEANADGLMFRPGDEMLTLPTFNGDIRLSDLTTESNVCGGPGMHYVVFEPGVINAWHTHAGGQVLICTDGIGYHQIEGQPVEVMHPGDVAMCPPDVKHWHGATPGSRFAHIAANSNPDRPGVEWFDLLTKEEYDNLPKE